MADIKKFLLDCKKSNNKYLITVICKIPEGENNVMAYLFYSFGNLFT